MGDEGSTRCILCGGLEFERIFSHEIQTYSAGFGGSSRWIDVRTSEVMRCHRCGLATRLDRVRKAIELSRDFGYPHFLSDAEPNDGMISTASDTLFSPHTGLEEIEEISLFKHPPGALLNIGIDGFDIIETARLYGWQSSSGAGQYGNLAEQSETACANCGPGREFDVVRLQGSLERADDPFAFLEQMGGFLRRNGLLAVSLPDFSGWDYPLYGEGLALWPVDLPKWFFTPQALEHLLAAAGYTTLKVTTFTATASQPAGNKLLSYHTDQVFPINLNEDGISSYGQRIPYFRVFARREEKRVAATRRLTAHQSVPSRKSQLMETLL